MPQFRVLGSLEVSANGHPLPLGGPKQRALLALLLMHAGRVLPSERIVDELWGDDPPRTASTSLQNFVSQLRKLLGPGILETKDPGYVLRVADDDVDVARFERLVAAARNAAEAEERAASLGEALALWRGPAYADFGFESFAQNEIRRLDELRLSATEDRIEAALELGRHRELIPELELLVAENSLRERLREHLMLALYRSGRQAEASEAYHDARKALRDELGLEPGPALQRLHGSILRQDAPLEPRSSTALDHDHYDQVADALLDGRLVVVLGFGVALSERPDGIDWSTESRFAPTAADVAAYLARRFECPPEHARDLVHVSQYVALTRGVGPLYDELHAVFDRDNPPSPVHQLAAELPRQAREAGVAQPLFVTTHFDQTLERAFVDAGEDVDIVSYIAAGRDRGKFLHLAPDGEATVIEVPNAYSDLPLEERPTILKLHGQVDRRPERDRESFVISEDDYIGYLAQAEIANLVPVTLAAKLRRSHFLFLGYALEEWHLRVFLHRVWGDQQVAYRSWAIQPNPGEMTRRYWRHRNVDIFDLPLGEYAEHVRTRLGAVVVAA